ncbi:translation initiation factor IF-2 associated domain-containing protein, partial [Kumtagia ephedrae]
MSDTKSGDDNTLTVNTKKTLSLKPAGVTQGTVRQNFSHGRTKQVVVETKKRKFSMPGERAEPHQQAPVFTPRPQTPAAPPPPARPQVAAPQPAAPQAVAPAPQSPP